jgi:hypothetical protein
VAETFLNPMINSCLVPSEESSIDIELPNSTAPDQNEGIIIDLLCRTLLNFMMAIKFKFRYTVYLVQNHFTGTGPDGGISLLCMR